MAFQPVGALKDICGKRPQAEGPVTARTGQGPSVGTEYQIVYSPYFEESTRLVRKGCLEGTRDHIPQTNGFIIATGQGLPVGAERQVVDPSLMALQYVLASGRGHVP